MLFFCMYQKKTLSLQPINETESEEYNINHNEICHKRYNCLPAGRYEHTNSSLPMVKDTILNVLIYKDFYALSNPSRQRKPNPSSVG